MSTLKHWDVHQHRSELRVSDRSTVYHYEQGVLCQAEKHWDCVINHPIEFGNKEEAYKWIKEGYIADLQESLCNLAVGFSKELFKLRET